METFEELEKQREAFESKHKDVLFKKLGSTLDDEEKLVVKAYNQIIDKITILVADMNIVTTDDDTLRSGTRMTTRYRRITGKQAVQKRQEAFRMLTNNPETSTMDLSKLLGISEKRALKWRKEFKSGWR